MSYNVTKYPQGTFSWADFFSKDIKASTAFMNGLMGWTSQDMPTGEGRPDYTMFSLDGKYVAGGSPVFDPNMPSFWTSYVTVDDVDAMTAKAEALGAKVTMKPMDVLDSGRMSTIQDPTGAQIALWQPNKHIGAGVVNIPGAMSWNELYTPDMEVSQKFYGDLFGWTFEVSKKMGDYTLIKNNGRSNGGMFPQMEDMKGMPPFWMVYFTVKDIEQSIAKTKELGGQVVMGPKEISVGKIAVIADPAGAHFMIMEMSVKPEEWIE